MAALAHVGHFQSCSGGKGWILNSREHQQLEIK